MAGAVTGKTPPKGLNPKGRAFWRRITKEFDLAPHEEAILELACGELDLLHKFQLALVNAPMMVTGSMGQQTANPIFGEFRQHSITFNTLIKSLKLPAVEEAAADAGGTGGKTPAQLHGQAAANARWTRARGA